VACVQLRVLDGDVFFGEFAVEIGPAVSGCRWLRRWWRGYGGCLLGLLFVEGVLENAWAPCKLASVEEMWWTHLSVSLLLRLLAGYGLAEDSPLS
jgi:hypothetical protein